EKTAKPAIATPRLKTLSAQPISLEVRDVPLRGVFDVISRSSGVSFVFDKDVRADQRTTIVLRNASVEELIRLVLQTNQLEQKLVNETTVLVYPNTPQKQREYQELVVKSFYLVNADVRQTANMIRTMVKTRDLFIDEKLNLLVIKDTPSAVRLAERLIAAQDLAEPEVMLQVEVMEVGTSRLLELGIRWPTELGVGLVGAGGTPGQITGTEARNINGDLVRLTFTDPLVLISLLQQDGTTNVLANPRIRVKNKEKARIHIGDRVPVITTTAGATGFVSESVNYLDVGLKLEVEPTVYLDNEVGIKVALEVSSIGGQVRTSSGTVAYQVGTRNTSTTLRLRDGETQVLAGLISNEDRRNASQVPGLANLPVLGRLFRSNDDTVNRTEVVLLITPHVIRNIQRPGVRMEQFNSGTEAAIGGAALSVPAIPPSFPPTPPENEPAPSAPAQPAPESREALPPAAGPQPYPPGER
ncbi:MAG TPA: secretin N-terminal domain-containing protein, partial [Burkholderiales bacterium]